MSDPLHMVTGAYGYSGRYIARRLLARGIRVATLTGHPNRPDPFGGCVPALPFDFDAPDRLARSLEGVTVLYNTYWVRFDHGQATHRRAVENTRVLFRAAAAAGVKRVVHVSITNPSSDSPLPYFAGKAALERDLAASGLSHAILRPAVLFGGRDVLINNIAWILRRSPVIAVAGDGRYGIQPIHVEDMARLAVEAGEGRSNTAIDAVGPEVFEFSDLVRLIAVALGRRVRIWKVPRWALSLMAKAMRPFVGDVVLTRDEIDGLAAGLLVSAGRPTGTVELSRWLQEEGARLGLKWANELGRHYRAPASGQPCAKGLSDEP